MPLVTQLPWTRNLIILSQSKGAEEREVYLRLAVHQPWDKRELERQFRPPAFENAVLTLGRVTCGADMFKDAYALVFLNSPAEHSETDMQCGLFGPAADLPHRVGTGFLLRGCRDDISLWS